MALWTNLAKHSADFTQTWSTSAPWTEAAATSVIPGQTARKFTGDGVTSSLNVNQTAGTLSSGAETLAWVVENVDAAGTQIAIRDATVGDWVGRVLLTWSTGLTSIVSSGVGTISDHGSLDLGTTPNGGTEARLIWVTATADNPGNSRGVWCYPVDTPASSLSAILHWAGHFEASTYAPAFLVNGATVTEQRVIDLGDHKVSVRPSARYVDLDHKRRRASGKLSSTLHGDAVRRREWTFGTEIEGRTTGEELQRELDAPGTVHLVHNPLISSVTGVGAGVDATNVRRMDGPQEDHVRVTFDAVEVVPA